MRKIKKAYMIDRGPFHNGLVRHVLTTVAICDPFDGPSIFIPTFGWTTRDAIESLHKLIELPLEYSFTNSGLFKPEGWWTTNWSDPLWAWCYGSGRQPDFQFCRRVGDAIFAY